MKDLHLQSSAHAGRTSAAALRCAAPAFDTLSRLRADLGEDPAPIDMLDLGYSSKLNAEWAFLAMLRDAGREAADAFLQTNVDSLGKRSSLDLDELLDGV